MIESENNLTTILDDEPAQEAPQEQPVEQETGEEPQSEEPTQEAAKEPEAEDKTEETPASEESKEPSVADLMAEINGLKSEASGLKAGIAAERTKRLELEAKQAQAQKQPAPDMFEDPEGYQNHIQRELDQQVLNTKITLSKAMAEREFGVDEYASKLEVFEQLTADDPGLLQKAFEADSPAHFVYEHAKAHQDREAIGDPAAYEEKIRSKVLLELEGKAEEIAEAKVKALLSKHLPNSLADETSTGGRTVQNVDYDQPMTKLLGE